MATRRDFLKLAGLGAAAAMLTGLPRLGRAASAALRGVGNAAASQPNIIIILADDLGYADVGLHGCKDIPTPHIDSIGRGGVRCTSGYVTGPYCSPTRAALMTGRYQQRYGCEYLTGWQGTPGLSLKETTVAQRLKQAGYVTGIVGKWHLGDKEGYHPLDRGFDEFFGFLGGGHVYLPPKDRAEPDSGEYSRPILRDRQPVKETEYLTDAFGREGAAFIARHKDKPFFLYLAFNAVHTPLQATEKYRSRFPDLTGKMRPTYAAMTSAMDDAIGLVLKQVREAGLESRTLLFFLSDNGGPITHNAPNGSSNDPLRGGKAETWEGGIRVPFMAQWPGVLPAGSVYDNPVIQMDITATALAVAGVEAKPEWQLDGVDLLPFFLKQKQGAPHEALCWRLGGLMAIRSGDWKLVTPYTGPASMGPQPEGFDPFTNAHLFNVTKDVAEQNPLEQQNPQVVADLKARWTEWNRQMPVMVAARADKADNKGKTKKSATKG